MTFGATSPAMRRARSTLAAHLAHLASEARGRGADDARAVLAAVMSHVGQRDLVGRAVELRGVLGPGLSCDGFRRALGLLARLSPSLFARDGRGLYTIRLKAAWRAGAAEVEAAGAPARREDAVARWSGPATPKRAELPAAFRGMRRAADLLERHPVAAHGASLSAAARALLVAAGETASRRDVEQVARGLQAMQARGVVTRDGDRWAASVEAASAGGRRGRVGLSTPAGLSADGRLVRFAVEARRAGLIDGAEFERRIAGLVPVRSFAPLRYQPPDQETRAARLAEARADLRAAAPDVVRRHVRRPSNDAFRS